MTIKDADFLKTLYRRYCLRPVSTRADRYALTKLHIEVRKVADGSVTVSVCDNEGRVLDIGWQENEAWGRWALCVNDAIMDADTGSLSSFVRRFLLKHGVIDRQGNSRLEGVA